MKAGSVIELDLDKKLVYLQLTHNHFAKGDAFWYGWFCRVLPGTFSKRPALKQLKQLVMEPEQFGCFFANAKDLEVVAEIPVPPGSELFPTCKQYIGSQPSPNSVWVFWDGQEERVTYRLPAEAANLPNREIVDTVVIRQRIKQNWSASQEVPHECLDPQNATFIFSDYPLLSDFEQDRNRFGDIYGFLASRGLYQIAPEETSIKLSGIGPFENSVAEHWLNSLSGINGWDSILLPLQKFTQSPARNTNDSALVMAASGLILASAGLLKCPHPKILDALSQSGPIPPDLIRTAMVAMMEVHLRSGLKDLWSADPRGSQWQALTSKMQLQLIELRQKQGKK
ncbi:MAG: hypothetical protein ACO1RA_05515 [Planctomycetaceae bacterium]